MWFENFLNKRIANYHSPLRNSMTNLRGADSMKAGELILENVPG